MKDTFLCLLTQDAHECQKLCQETTEVLGCKMFTWDSITFKCTLLQNCVSLNSGYHISGPKFCNQTTTTTTATPCFGNCTFEPCYFVGDGYCDDGANNLDCNFDGGDCCGTNVMTNFCAGIQI